MSAKLSEQEVLDVLRAIERGDVTCPIEQTAQAREQFVNNVEFTFSNGWVFVIFNDCDEWDYIDTVTAPDGRSLSFNDIWANKGVDGAAGTGRLWAYSPPQETREIVWGMG